MSSLVKNMMRLRKGAAALLLALASVTPTNAKDFVEKKFEFPFKMVKRKAERNFILLRLPDDVGSAELQFKNIPDPMLILDYVSEDENTLAGMTSQINVKYIEEDNQTIVRFMREGKFAEYNCVAEPNDIFLKGTCVRKAILILPPDVEATILQNKTVIYSQADVLEIKKRYFPNLVKPDPAATKATKKEREAKLKELNGLFRKGLITKEEYAEKKKALLDGM